MRAASPGAGSCCRIAAAGLLFAAFLAGGTGTLCGATPPSSAAPGVFGSDAIKAVFLFNFMRFTEWPPTALPDHAPFVVGVAGSRALEDGLVALADRQTVMDRRVRVVRVKTTRDLEGCHVLYISSSAAPGEELGPGADELLPYIRGKPVLTVSSDPDFLRRGGIVNFFTEEAGKLRFEIAPENAKSAGLVLSSRLLSLARIVALEPADEPKAP